MQKAPQTHKAEEYTSPQLLCMEIATESGIAMSETDITIPGFGDDEEVW